MLINITRTLLQLRKYTQKRPYPRTELLIYILTSTTIGITLAARPHTTISNIRLLTVTSILLGFSLNALMLLSNTINKHKHRNYSDTRRAEKIENYQKQTLYILIHSLGVAFTLILITSFALLLPNLTVHIQTINLTQVLVFSLACYYLLILSTAITSLAEITHIHIHEPSPNND